MSKRTAILLIVLLTAGLTVLGYFLQRGREHLLSDPYKAVPKGAVFIIETADLRNFLNSLSSGKGLFREIRKMKGLETFDKSLDYLSGRLKSDEFKEIFKSRTSILSFYTSGKRKLMPLLSMTIPDGIGMSDLKNILSLSGTGQINSVKHYGKSFLELPFRLGQDIDTLYLTITSGLLLCSTSQNLAIAAIRQTGLNSDVRNEPGFSKVSAASGKNENKIFVIFPNLAGIFRSSLNEQSADISRKIAAIPATAVADIYFNEDGVILSGYTESMDSTEFIYRYKSAAPGSFHSYNILPSSTVLFESLILPEETALLNNQDTSISEAARSLASRISPFTGEEVTRAIIDDKGIQDHNNTLIICELKNRTEAEQIFLNELGTGNRENKLLFFEPGDQVRIPVYKTHFKGLAALLFPGSGPNTDDSYITFYENFLITGSSFETLSRFLYDNLLKKTLANDLVYREFESTLPSRSVYLFYCVPERIITFLSQYLNDDVNHFLDLNRNSINKILSAGYQFIPSNDMIYNSISVKFREEAREESTAEWETLLDTAAATRPFFFTNHLNQSKEIFIQDLKNNIYLISSAGIILWKVPLEERINGSVYMIDYYRNGKYQLLFAGKEYIHLIDRNGNYVERYPFKLRSPATNSLALFDYDNNHDYRLLIAGEDRLIYAYDKNGNTVKGWKPFKTEGTVTSEISYFRISGKDYLIVSDGLSMYFLDRRGNIRLRPVEPVSRANGSALRLIQGSDPSIVCSAPDGTIQHIYFNGQVKKFTLKKKFSGNHCFDVFDINGDGFGENIFIDEGKIYLYDNNKNEIFTRDFGKVELKGPIDFVFSSSDRKTGLLDNTNKLVYLLGKNGEILNGFPLKGASMFSIGKLSEKGIWHLLVGGSDGFLYNYRIDTETK